MTKFNTNSNDPVFLMCPPDFYAIPEPDPKFGSANDFEVEGYKLYRQSPTKFRKEAERQWKGLWDIFNSLGVKVVEMEPQENHPDMVFTADPSFSLAEKGKSLTVLSNFTNVERQKEVELSAQTIEQFKPDRAIIRSHHRMEGTGDNVYDSFRDLIWSGFCSLSERFHAASGRSDLRAHHALSTVTDTEVVSLLVRRPYFHVDTSVAPLSKGHILCAAGGLQPFAQERLIDKAFHRYGLPVEDYLIRVHPQDAARYACNLRCVDDVVIMPEVSEGLKDQIRDKGYQVITTDLSYFIHSGGAVHCLTNNLNEQKRRTKMSEQKLAAA